MHVTNSWQVSVKVTIRELTFNAREEKKAKGVINVFVSINLTPMQSVLCKQIFINNIWKGILP